MLKTIGFGGGCHWCTEAVFMALRGMDTVEQGFIRSISPDDSWSEAVRIRYDPGVIDLVSLIEIHLRTHSSTSNHSMRGKYRSAVYTVEAEQRTTVTNVLRELQADFDKPLVTRALPLEEFMASESRIQRYYEKGPERPFCKRYIDPKLALLREQFAADMA